MAWRIDCRSRSYTWPGSVTTLRPAAAVELALERGAFGGVPAQLKGVQECGPCLVATAEAGEHLAADRGEQVRAGQFAP